MIKQDYIHKIIECDKLKDLESAMDEHIGMGWETDGIVYVRNIFREINEKVVHVETFYGANFKKEAL